MNHTNKNTWCINAFHSISSANDGITRPCCMYKRPYIRGEIVLGQTPLLDHFNSAEFVELRNTLASGTRHPNCHRCWQEEDAGRESKRIRDNKKWTGQQNGLVYVDLSMGNTCNIKCRTCSPHASSQWSQELYDTKYIKIATKEEYFKEIRKYSKSYDDESPFWKELEDSLSTIRHLEFYGGEPLLSKKMWSILEKAVELGYSKDIDLHYATNGTTWPIQTHLWSNFKTVNLSFSIDGITDQFEYMRYPAKWNDVMLHMTQDDVFKINMKPSWCVTLSNLNIYYLDTIIDEFNRQFKGRMGLYLNLVHWPEHFNISIMPDNVKKIVIEKLKSIPLEQSNQLPGIIKFIENGTPDKTKWGTLLEEIRLTDDYRGQDYSKTFTEFSNIIGYKK